MSGVRKWKAGLCTRLRNYHWRELPQVFLSRQKRLFTKKNYVTTNICCRKAQIFFAGDKYFSWQKVYVATSIIVSRLFFSFSRQAYFYRVILLAAAANDKNESCIILSRQKMCFVFVCVCVCSVCVSCVCVCVVCVCVFNCFVFFLKWTILPSIGHFFKPKKLCMSSFHRFLPFFHCLVSFHKLDKGDYPENSHVVFCPNKQRYFEPFMWFRTLAVIIISLFCFLILTPSLPQPVQCPGWKMHGHACKQCIFRSYNSVLWMPCVWMKILLHASANMPVRKRRQKDKGFRFRTFIGCF